MGKRGDPAARRARAASAVGSAVHAIYGGSKRERRHFLADARLARKKVGMGKGIVRKGTLKYGNGPLMALDSRKRHFVLLREKTVRMAQSAESRGFCSMLYAL
jgi:hypothetical protein